MQLVLSLIPALAILSLPVASQAAIINRLGLFGAEYTLTDGSQVSELDFADGKFAGGSSTKYSGAAIAGSAAWVADVTTGVTTRLGLLGADFTQTNGYQESELDFLAGGYAVGTSTKYTGTNNRGDAAWIANLGTGVTTRIGFFDAAHTATNGNQLTAPLFLQGGLAAGYSRKYSGASFLGQDVWVASGATGITTRVGLYSADYTQSTGLQESSVTALHGGHVLGQSLKYSGTTALGQAVWVADAAGATIRVGLFDGDYTHTNGTQSSTATMIGDSYAGGLSVRYAGTANLGAAAWLANVNTGVTMRLGFTTSEFTSSTGSQSSSVLFVEGNYGAGFSSRFSGATLNGQAAWIGNGVTGVTTRVGFVGSDYTNASGVQDSRPTFFDGTHAAGYSQRYAGALTRGRAAWIADAATGTTTRVGLLGSDFTMPDGSQTSTVTLLEDGYAAGTSQKYNASGNQIGQAAWIAGTLSGTTTRVGVTAGVHTRSDGFQSSAVAQIAGNFASGYSTTFVGALTGQTAWVYDVDDAVLAPITLSIRPSDGYSFSEILSLYDTGLAVGFYTLFDNAGADLGRRAFFWTPTMGARDLGSFVPGGLAAAGWESLIFGNFADPQSGVIFGYGTLPGQHEDSEVLYATAVPEPGSVSLFALGALLLARRRRLGA